MTCYWCYQPICCGENGYYHAETGQPSCLVGNTVAQFSSPMPRESYFDHVTHTFKLWEN